MYRHKYNEHEFPNGRPCLKCGKCIKDFYKHKWHCPLNNDSLLIKEKEKNLHAKLNGFEYNN